MAWNSSEPVGEVWSTDQGSAICADEPPRWLSMKNPAHSTAQNMMPTSQPKARPMKTSLAMMPRTTNTVSSGERPALSWAKEGSSGNRNTARGTDMAMRSWPVTMPPPRKGTTVNRAMMRGSPRVTAASRCSTPMPAR